MRCRITVLLLTAAVSAYDQSLSDCETFADLFSNTCGGTAYATADIASESGDVLTCTGDTLICVEDSTLTYEATCAHNQ